MLVCLLRMSALITHNGFQAGISFLLSPSYAFERKPAKNCACLVLVPVAATQFNFWSRVRR